MGSVDSLRSGLRPDRHGVPVAHLRSRTRSVELPTFPSANGAAGHASALTVGIEEVPHPLNFAFEPVTTSHYYSVLLNFMSSA